MKINIPQKAAQILKTLNVAGYEAYVVGGPGFHPEPGAGGLGHYNFCTSGAGEGTFSQNCRYGDPAWNSNRNDG